MTDTLSAEQMSALKTLENLRPGQWFVCATGIRSETVSDLIRFGYALGTSDMAQITEAGRVALCQLEVSDEQEAAGRRQESASEPKSLPQERKKASAYQGYVLGE